jgi:hypothetical protein
MNITVYHDDRGNILSLAARSNDAPPAHMTSSMPLRSSEIEEPTVTDDLQPGEICQRLAELRASRRVQVDAGRARLSDRETSEGHLS